MRMTSGGRDGADLLAGLALHIWEERARKIELLTERTRRRVIYLRQVKRNPKMLTETEKWEIRIWATKKVDGEVR